MNEQPSCSLSSGLKWMLAGFALGALTAPIWGVLLGADPGVDHPRLKAPRRRAA